MKFATKAIHIGQEADSSTGATVPPIHITSTYTQAAPGDHKGFEYSRSNNPTRQNYEQCLASLENGADAAAFSSGLQATTTTVISHLKTGNSLVAFGDMYGGTYRLFEKVFRPWGLDARYINRRDPAAFAETIDDTTRLVWLETPTNPMLNLLDIAAISQAVKDKANRLGTQVLLAVDNTFATPALQQPLELGADLVIHSTTKYIGGHSDVIGGVVVAKNAELMEPVRFCQNAAGGVPGPFDCYLGHRGAKTLELRMKAHCENAIQIARWAVEQPQLEKVIYPGLAEHPDHNLCKNQMTGAGGIVSVVVKGEFEAASKFMSALKIFACAESLGGVESIANHPAVMTHASVPKERREELGVVDGLVRLSVGIEDPVDLLDDLEQALKAV